MCGTVLIVTEKNFEKVKQRIVTERDAKIEFLCGTLFSLTEPYHDFCIKISVSYYLKVSETEITHAIFDIFS